MTFQQERLSQLQRKVNHRRKRRVRDVSQLLEAENYFADIVDCFAWGQGWRRHHFMPEFSFVSAAGLLSLSGCFLTAAFKAENATPTALMGLTSATLPSVAAPPCNC